MPAPLAPSAEPVAPGPLPAAAAAFLGEAGRFGTLATIDPDGVPHQAVVWYLVRDGALLLNSAVGRRWPANLRRDARCTLTVEDGYRYVTVRGRAEVDEDPERAQADIAALARRYHDAARAQDLIERVFRPQRRVSFLLHPETVSIHGVSD